MKQQLFILSTSLKASLSNLLLIVLAFLAPIKALIIIIGVCIALDTLMGLYRAKKKNEAITSRKLSNVISKMVLYEIAVILFYCIEKFILSDIIGTFTDIPLVLTKLVSCTLIFIELQSVNESYQSIFGYSLWQKFRDLLARAKSIKGEVENVINKER